MIIYGISTLGKPILIQEDNEEKYSYFRMSFIIITFLLTILNTIFIIKYFINFINSKKVIQFKYIIKQNRKNSFIVVITYLFHAVIHSFHYIDNIYRPVSYFEPKYLYQKYILSTMEITFYFNFPLTICGILFMKNLFKKGYVDYTYLTVYICSSLMTLMHYRIETPYLYTTSVNFSISGEGVSILIFICSTFMIRQKPEKKKYKLFIVLFFALILCILILVNLGVLYMLFSIILFMSIVFKLTEGIIYEDYEKIPNVENQ